MKPHHRAVPCPIFCPFRGSWRPLGLALLLFCMAAVIGWPWPARAAEPATAPRILATLTNAQQVICLDAATGKQLDDVNAQIDLVNRQMNVTRQQIQVQKNAVGTQNRGILSQQKPLEKRAAQVADLLNKTHVRNPVTGVVLAKYAEAGELTAVGKALYKVADLSSLNLRAYVTGTQLPQIRLGQPVTVRIDSGAGGYRELPGTITWISDKAEFTPKTIQTKEERANLVYAVKIKVKNDGYLKIGMYGEVKL